MLSLAALLPAALLVLPGRALADIITLKNGSRIEGLVERTEPGPLCTKCLGKGEVECPSCRGSGRTKSGVRCPGCQGKVRVGCRACEGRGRGERHYIIRLRGGARVTIAESDVLSIERSDVPPEELLSPRGSYKLRLSKLTPGVAQDELALARWALRRGLHTEASKHARRAAEVDPALAAEARGVYEAAEGKLLAGASRAFAAALEEIRAGRLEKGLRAIESARRRHARSPLLSDAEHERRFLREHASDLVARYGRTLAEIELSARRRLRLACPVCGGAGSARCRTCRGTGEGTCPRCRGTGEDWCKECNGTTWRVCIRCGGTGKPKRIQFRIPVACTDCRGRGVIECTRCKKGRLACRACGGKGSVANSCGNCGGTGRKPCEPCLGTGLAKVTKLRWGPVREAPETPDLTRDAARPRPVVWPVRRAPPGPRRQASRRAPAAVPVWQGVRRGCIITAMRARDLYEGALTAQLGVILGEKREFLVVCVDNRDGREQVGFYPERQGLRLVTDDAKQLAAEPPGDVGKLSSGRPKFKALLAQLRPTAVLPGVMANVIAAFPAGTDFATVTSVYWGREDPLRLARRHITGDELARIRKTLR